MSLATLAPSNSSNQTTKKTPAICLALSADFPSPHSQKYLTHDHLFNHFFFSSLFLFCFIFLMSSSPTKSLRKDVGKTIVCKDVGKTTVCKDVGRTTVCKDVGKTVHDRSKKTIIIFFFCNGNFWVSVRSNQVGIKSDMTWIVWALTATILWGAGYSFLRPTGDVNPLVSQILFGGGTFVCNLTVMGIWAAVTGDGDSLTTFVEPWQALFRHRQSWFLLGYVLCNSFAGLAYLYASTLPDVPLSVLTALTAAYPLVTTVILFAVFQEFEKIDLRLAIPGIIVTATGCALLALSPKPQQLQQLP
jgi:hypothetical protein